MNRPFRLGLTGSIATGKSTALAAFAARGIPVFSSDDEVHRLYAGSARRPIEALFPGVVREGVVDRAELSRRLVASPETLAALEAVVHPMVRAAMGRFFAAAEAADPGLAVADVPLLFESGHDYGFDAVAVTFCDEATQRARALARPGMTVEKLAAIVARQLPQAEKKRRADFLIDTSGTLEETDRAVQQIIDAIRHGAESTR